MSRSGNDCYGWACFCRYALFVVHNPPSVIIFISNTTNSLFIVWFVPVGDCDKKCPQY